MPPSPAARARALATLAALLVAAPAAAWFAEGHRRVATAAVGLLPAEVPESFRAGAAAVSEAAVDPDLWKARDAPALADREWPEHFLDLELLAGDEPPVRRSDYLRWLFGRGLEAQRAGLLRHAIVEGSERLALCFAEQRRWPAEAAIAEKCRVYAGWLAHYAADLEQPLHTTIHHDGWALPSGEPPFTGIHQRIDALFERVAFDAASSLAGVELRRIVELGPAVAAELAASHALIDAVYALEPRLDDELGVADPQVVAFTCARYRAAARFVAELFLWSWERSAEIELPSWLER